MMLQAVSAQLALGASLAVPTLIFLGIQIVTLVADVIATFLALTSGFMSMYSP